MTPAPTIGRIVHYRSRTGNYTVPAVITATTATLAPTGVELYRSSGGRQGTPPLSSDMHVHLAVLTPGIPGCRAEAQDFVTEGVRRAENIGGTYQEWDVPLDEMAAGDQSDPLPGTWAWPPFVKAATPVAQGLHGDSRAQFIGHMREFAGELAGSDEARRVIYALDFMESRRAPPIAGGQDAGADPVLRAQLVQDIAAALVQACAARPEGTVGAVLDEAQQEAGGIIGQLGDEELLAALRSIAGPAA